MKFVKSCENYKNLIHIQNTQIKGKNMSFHIFNNPTKTTKRNLKIDGEKI